jgi:hypothetical protein
MDSEFASLISYHENELLKVAGIQYEQEDTQIELLEQADDDDVIEHHEDHVGGSKHSSVQETHKFRDEHTVQITAGQQDMKKP